MTVKKSQKKQKLRNAEYFDLQETLDRLYAKSAQGKCFTALMELVAADENILLAYRNISKNKGSKTAGAGGKPFTGFPSPRMRSRTPTHCSVPRVIQARQ